MALLHRLRGLAAIVSCASACAVDPDGSGSATKPGEGVEIAAALPPAEPVDRTALSALSAAAREKVAASPVPVLVPRRAALLSAATVLAGPHWVSVAAREDGVSVTLHATRAAHKHAHIPPAEGNRAVRKTRGFVTRNEGIWSVSWVEGGTAYTLDVECDKPFEGRCADESYALELASDLAFVGGAGVPR